jgi:ribosomal protein S27E
MSDGTERFEEDEHWSLGATDYAVDAPVRPYVRVYCPNCGTPNCFDYGIKKPDMPVDCVECGEAFRLRVAICEVDADTNHGGGDEK